MLARTSAAAFVNGKAELAATRHTKKHVQCDSRRGQRLSIRLCFSLLFFRLFYASYIISLPHNIMSCYARLLCIRISCFALCRLYVFASWLVSNWDTRGSGNCVGWPLSGNYSLIWDGWMSPLGCFVGLFKGDYFMQSSSDDALHPPTSPLIQLHKYSSECHKLHFACKVSLGLLLCLFFTTVPLCFTLKSTTHTHVFHLRDNISNAAFVKNLFGGNFYIPRHKRFRLKCHELFYGKNGFSWRISMRSIAEINHK